jgi:hypothetical protein
MVQHETLGRANGVLVALLVATATTASAEDSTPTVTLVGVEALDLSLESQQNWLPAPWLLAEPYVRVDIATDRNLIVLARQHRWLLNPLVARCKDGRFDPTARLAEALGVRDSVGIVAFTRLSNTSDIGMESAPPVKYRFYFRIASYGEKPSYAYDLRTAPSDVCFYLGAIGQDRRKMNTDVVVISQETLQQAILDFGRRLAVPEN